MALDAPTPGDRLQPAALEPLRALPIVGDLRGAGHFYALLRLLSPRLCGLLCGTDYRGEPVVQISTPLVAGQEQFEEIADILGGVLEEASDRMAVAA